MGTKFGTNVSNKMLLNVAKLQGYSFYRSWVIKGKPTGGGGGGKITPPTHTQIRVKEVDSAFHCCPVNRECSWKKRQIEKDAK